MRRSKTNSFIIELRLKICSKTEQKLLARFQAGRQLYNACLSEAMTRMNLVKNSDAYICAKSLPKGKSTTLAFKEAREVYRYSEYKLHSFAQSNLQIYQLSTSALDEL
jgi:putative transposase